MMRSFFAHVLADALAPSMARWSRKREIDILESGRALPDELVRFAKGLGIPDPEGIRLQLVSRIPLPLPPWLVDFGRRIGLPVFEPAGMALGRGISAISDDPSLLRHEIVHLGQYQRLGSHQAFMHAYILQCVVHGYFDAPLEQEARRESEP
ncbi:hypothetical protein [Haloferula sp.]|uniref:hypothetical protein n=1 Tax=Haloferula sp. TaxID=2497595 RepID=UPI00329A8245